MIDGITLSVDQNAPSEPLKATLQTISKEVSADAHKRLIATPQWSIDTGGVLYVRDDSDPTYLEIQAHKLLLNGTVIAVTSGDKSKVDLMQQIVRKILGNYVPGDFAPGTFSRFGIKEGSVHQSFGVAEDLDADFHVGDAATKLNFITKVIAEPVKVDLFDRTSQMLTYGRENGVVYHNLRKTHRTVAGQRGEESVNTDVHEGVNRFVASFETPGVPNSASQPHLEIGLDTLDNPTKALNEKEFLTLLDTILDSLKVAP